MRQNRGDINMNILFIAHQSEFLGGANRSLFQIIKGIQMQKQDKIIVIVPKEQGEFNNCLDNIGVRYFSENYYWITDEQKQGYKDLVAKAKMIVKAGIDYYRSYKLAKVLKEYKIDVVYTNTRVIYIGAFLAKRLKVPHIWHVREFLEENKIQSVPFSYRIMNRYTDKIIVISRQVEQSLDKKIEKEKIELIYNGLPYKEYKPVERAKKSTFDISLIGSIQEAKGQMEAVKAIELLSKKGYKDIKLHLVGGGIEAYLNQIKDYIEEKGLKDQVILYGEQKDVDHIRKDMNMELMCSKCEAFGRVTVEAMQSGLIVVGSSSGATPEIIKNNWNGFLYKTNDVEDLAEKIEHVYNCPKDMERIRNNAINFTKENFTEEKNTKEVYELIKKVVYN